MSRACLQAHDKRLEKLGVNFARQYDLVKGILESDKEIMQMLVSKYIQVIFE